MGEDAVDLLFQFTLELTEEDMFCHFRRECPHFNSSTLLFLPKKAVDVLDDGTEVYDAASVRPLNVTNTDNRLVANAVRFAIEPILADLISTDQRGFIGGRSMLANLVDVDEAMVEQAATSDTAVALFKDFRSAFPSIEHEMFHAYFSALKWPSWLLRLISIFYLGNTCQISMGSRMLAGFSLTRGIRQGCPLSPLLFAAVSELLLRRLRVLVPGALSRAWADDLAMILRDGMAHLPLLARFFLDFPGCQGLAYILVKQYSCRCTLTTNWTCRRRWQLLLPVGQVSRSAAALATSASLLGQANRILLGTNR